MVFFSYLSTKTDLQNLLILGQIFRVIFCRPSQGDILRRRCRSSRDDLGHSGSTQNLSGLLQKTVIFHGDKNSGIDLFYWGDQTAAQNFLFLYLPIYFFFVFKNIDTTVPRGVARYQCSKQTLRLEIFTIYYPEKKKKKILREPIRPFYSLEQTVSQNIS